MRRYYFFMAVLVVFAGAVVAMQSTGARGYKADEQAQNDLSQLSENINTQASRDNRLPDSLSGVKLSQNLQGHLSDYTYQPTGYNTYQLCATFVHEHQPPAGQRVNYMQDNLYFTDTTYHGAGHQCFNFSAYGVEKPLPSPLFTPSAKK